MSSVSRALTAGLDQYIAGNQLRLLCNGTEFFPALLLAIEEAQREIYLETYIFANDQTAQSVVKALAKAAQRGVATHVLVDGFGSKNLATSLIRTLLEAGVKFARFRPNISPWTLNRYRLRRLHRKLAQVDGRIAFVGGINIIDDTDTPGQIPPRLDFAVQIEGPLVKPISIAMHKLWLLAQLAQFRQPWANLRRRYHTPDPPRFGPGQTAKFTIRDNLAHRNNIEKTYLQAIRQAHQEIVIANAYFLPGWRFRSALMDAAGRGVRVILLLQGRVEYRLLHYATRALYGPLLAAGVEIYEYTASFLHAKVATVDSDWATVGSSNIDPFSLLLAREANVFVQDPKFTQELREQLEQFLQQGSKPVTAQYWQRQNWFSRLKIRLAYQLVRMLMGLLGVVKRRF